MKKIFVSLWLMFWTCLYAETIDPRFHSFEEIQSLLDSLDQLEEYSDVFRVDTLGYSGQENLPILAVKISDNVQQKEDEPRVLFLGQCHAEEILGVEAVIELIHALLNPEASMVTHAAILKQELETWIVPTHNPEGLNVVHAGLDVSYRKNKRDFSPNGTQPNGLFDYDPSIGNDIDGVDLNRNYDFNWVFGDTFMENDPTDYAAHYDYYRGPQPFSESEVQAIRALALEHDFLFSIAWHSSRSGRYSEKVISSWKWANGKNTPDNEEQKTIADALAGMLQKEESEDHYESVQSVSRRGNAHDWFYSATGCFQYLVECGTANIQPDSALIEDTMDRLMPGMLYLMNRTIGYNEDASQITGIVTDASGIPVEDAEVIIIELSGGVQQPRLTDTFGRYRRIVAEGSYTVNVKKKGYSVATAQVTANSSSIAEQNFTLESSPQAVVTFHIEEDHHFQRDYPLCIVNGMFGSDTLSAQTGVNPFTLDVGVWDIFVTYEDGDYFPWMRNVELNSNTEYFIEIQTADIFLPLDFSDTTLWTSVGDWTVGEDTLKSQHYFTYANGTSSDTLELKSQFIDVAGMQQVAVELTHRYELEWDIDSVFLSIVDGNDSVLASLGVSGHHWNAFRTDRIIARETTSFDSVRVQLSLKRDESISYRGWEIASMKFMAVDASYLSTSTSSPSIKPGLNVSDPYPNPSNGMLTINLSGLDVPVSVSMYNLLGQEVYSESIPVSINQQTTWAFSMPNQIHAGLSSGVYFLQFKTPQETIIKKCVYLRP
ncbi:MAG: M14 family zinc carboxypeptidase [Candidatus Marinimicrobia bacterium]|jgi:hypothetical protein|nr:M14 family zinc carboxypeptidase [Candidatus Neomarinimicrobiota bacterium]